MIVTSNLINIVYNKTFVGKISIYYQHFRNFYKMFNNIKALENNEVIITIISHIFLSITRRLIHLTKRKIFTKLMDIHPHNESEYSNLYIINL